MYKLIICSEDELKKEASLLGTAAIIGLRGRSLCGPFFIDPDLNSDKVAKLVRTLLACSRSYHINGETIQICGSLTAINHIKSSILDSSYLRAAS